MKKALTIVLVDKVVEEGLERLKALTDRINAALAQRAEPGCHCRAQRSSHLDIRALLPQTNCRR